MTADTLKADLLRRWEVARRNALAAWTPDENTPGWIRAHAKEQVIREVLWSNFLHDPGPLEP